MQNRREKMMSLCERLQPIIKSEDNETGEYCGLLADICRYASYTASEEFLDAIIKEIESLIELHEQLSISDDDYYLGMTADKWAKGLIRFGDDVQQLVPCSDQPKWYENDGGVYAEVVFRDGITEKRFMHHFSWHHDGGKDDIVRFRIINPKET